MSSISVNASDPGLAQFFQKLTGNVQSPAAGSAPAVDPTTTASDAASTATAQQGTQAAGGHHHGHHGGGGLFSKVQEAVTSALKSAQDDGSSDPNQVIQDAIAKVFQQNGATPANGDPATATPGQDADGTQDPSSTTATSADSAKQAFLQTLQSFGVDSSQFHSDFLSAIKSVQNGGEADPSTVLGNFPPGSGLDTTA
jgi:hypothetical protein